MASEYDFIIVGAGVIGPAIATGLAKYGRSVLILERDLNEPDRIVGELLQPGGVESLKKLGMEKALEGIDAVKVYGYEVIHNGRRVHVSYPKYEEEFYLSSSTKVGDTPSGRGFHHGKFIMALREIASQQPGVTLQQAIVTDLVRNEYTGHVLGVDAKLPDGKKVSFFAKQTFMCDGINSKFRKDFIEQAPVIKSYFAAAILEDPKLVRPNHGHVIIGSKHKPILVYEISPTEARILCDVPAPLPSIANGDLKAWLEKNCLPNMPEDMKPSFQRALNTQKLRTMPNQYLPASQNVTPGLILLGDAMNMRHPLTGGGMTVAFNDAVRVTEMLGPRTVDIGNYKLVLGLMKDFYKERKNGSAVINVLSVALYSLFSSDSAELQILQNGCFEYFKFGGDYVNGPASLLSGLLEKPNMLFYHFFAVAFWAIYFNFIRKGVVGFPLALLQVFTTLYTAVIVFLPFYIKELW